MEPKRFAVLAALALGMSAGAQERLATIDGSQLSGAGQWRFDGRATFHRSAENRTYLSLDWRYGLKDTWEIGARGTFANKGRANGLANMSSGGSDMELIVRYAPVEAKGLAVGAGLAFPNTPAQTRPFLTYQGIYKLPVEDSQIALFVGGRGVVRSDSNILGVSGGFSAEIGRGWSLVGDLTVVATGNNTRDADTGAARRLAVYGFGVRFAAPTTEGSPDWGFFFGLGNGLGVTTGTSLSAAIGNRPALSIGFTIRGKS